MTDRTTAPATSAAILAALARPADLRALPLSVLHMVMALRLCALARSAGRDPMAELATRLGSVPAAEALVRLARTVGRTWPEAYVAGRPCCLAMTPDERTLANVARAALRGDRGAASTELDGFVRVGRHEALFDAAVRCAAELAVPGPRA